MSGSRKSLRKGTVFNPRASNEWSKDDSKFGQRMLEKMGWKHGQGIGLNNQGITENIKVRLKLDSKGLGYQIKEDQWLEVRSEFSDLLSQLSQGVENEDEAFNKNKKSLEAVSQSSRTRVHYHKFTHGKDIARYKKDDLIGILGKKEKGIPDKKEFIKSGNMDEYFKSKMKSKKNDTNNSDLTVNNIPEVDDQSNDTSVQPLSKEDTNNSKHKSDSRKRKASMKKLNNEYETKEVCENESIDKNATNKYSDKTESIGFNDIVPSRRKKKRISEILPINNDSEVADLCNNVNVENVPDENLKFQKSKKSVKKLPKSNEVEESNDQTSELTDEKPADQSIESTFTNGVVSKRRNKKRDKKCPIDSKIVVSLDEKILTSSPAKLDNENANEEKFDENNDVHLQLENSCEKKRKRIKKFDGISTGKSAEGNIRRGDVEENPEKYGNKTHRKNKHKSDHTQEQSIFSDDISLTTTSLPVIDDSIHELKKMKSKSKKKTDSCLKNENNEVVSNNLCLSNQENTDKKVIASNTLNSNSADFMKSVIDYNSCNNVEDFISNFEKHREELMNKYREQYKLKYLMSSSDKIQVYGDEFDGRKLDCKKSKVENIPEMRRLDRKNMSKADKIVAKARLLQMIKDGMVTHNFEGCNLANISGYGSAIC